MDNQKGKATGGAPHRSSSLFDFQRMPNPNQFMAPNHMPDMPGYFPYMLPPWSTMSYLYMDQLVRQLSLEREMRNGFATDAPDAWEFAERGRGSKRSARHKRKNLRGQNRDLSGLARSPDKRHYSHLYGSHPQGQDRHHPRVSRGQGHGYWHRPHALSHPSPSPSPSSSSSVESLAPCNSCRCCRYFSQSSSVLNIVGRARCGRKYVNDRPHDRRCQGQHNCSHLHEAPSDIPVRERPPAPKKGKSKGRKSGRGEQKENGKAKGRHDRTTDRTIHQISDKDEPEKDESDTESDGKSESGGSEAENRRFCGGTGDERSGKSQTKMSVKKKPRPKSTAYFLPISYLN